MHFDTLAPMRALLFAAMMALPVASSQSAFAEKRNAKVPKVAVVALEISGDGAPELRDVLLRHLDAGLRSTGARVSSLEQTLKQLKSSPELIGCTSSTCLERIGQATSSKSFVRARVTASGTNYEVQIQLMDTSNEGGVTRTVDDSCEVCTISELGAVITKASKKLLLTKKLEVYTVRFSTNPSGARITIDGANAGSAPLNTELSPGLHAVSASLAGRSTASSNINVKSSEDIQPFALALAPEVQAQVEGKKGPDYGLLKWGAVVGSGGLLVFGGILISQDGDPTDSDKRGSKKNTLWPGIGSVSGGVLLGAAAGWMFWREHKAEDKTKGLSININNGGASAAFHTRF